MRAVALDYTCRQLVEREVSEPALTSNGQVLLRVREVGVCGTDRDLAAFRFEFSPGDIVVPVVRRPCTLPCRWCASGRRDMCSSGDYSERGIVGAHGYFTELAVDSAADLVQIPADLIDIAVFVEPLSVVEKAIGNGVRLYPGTPESALVLGAGTVGLLAAMALSARGLAVTVMSVEPSGSERARLVEQAGIAYRNDVEECRFDIVIEAAGAAEAAVAGLRALAPGGVLVILGVNDAVPVPMLQLILNNQVVVGSVNAAVSDFATAVNDLQRFPARVLRRMISRERWSAHRSTLLGPLREAPKVVHVVD
jgi:threonine dehydrogenase-like Zn-dependent dehydrogenase